MSQQDLFDFSEEYDSDGNFGEFIDFPEPDDVEMSTPNGGCGTIGSDHSPNTLRVPETQGLHQHSNTTPATTHFSELGAQPTTRQIQFVPENGNTPIRHRRHQSNVGPRTNLACINCRKAKKKCFNRPRCRRCARRGKECVFDQDLPATSSLEGVNTLASGSDYLQAPAPATFPDPNLLRVNMDFLQGILRSEEGSVILAFYKTPYWMQIESELDGRGMSDFDAAIRQGFATTEAECPTCLQPMDPKFPFACPQDSHPDFNSSIPETNPANTIRSALREILRSKAWSDIIKSCNGGSLVQNETEALEKIISALREYSLTEDWVNVEHEPDLQSVAEFDTRVSHDQNPTSMLYGDASNPSHHHQQPNIRTCRPTVEDCSTLDKVGSAVIDAINVAVVGLCRVRKILLAYERRRQ